MNASKSYHCIPVKFFSIVLFLCWSFISFVLADGSNLQNKQCLSPISINTNLTTIIKVINLDDLNIIISNEKVHLSSSIISRDISFKSSSNRAKGRIIIVNPKKALLSMWYEEEALSYDFVSNSPTPESAKKFGSEFKAFPGLTIKEFKEKYKPYFAVNGHHSNCWLSNFLLINDGKLVIKTARGIMEEEKVLLSGEYNFFNIANGELIKVEIENGKATTDISNIANAIHGPILRENNKSIINKINNDLPAIGTDTVTIDPVKDTFAFSLIGKNDKGEIVLLSMAGTPESEGIAEISLENIDLICEELKISDAILLGISSDTQQYLTGEDVIMAEGRLGTTTGDYFTKRGGRPLSSIIYYINEKNTPKKEDNLNISA